MKEVKRITWIDWAKVICIYLMICCHAGQKGILLDVSYQFHMPAFFIISGILFRAKGVKNELLSFGIPILLCGFITQLFISLIVFKNSSTLQEAANLNFLRFNELLHGLLFSSNASLFQGCWFVFTLLIMRLLMGGVNFLYKKKIYVLAFCMLWSSFEAYIPLYNELKDFIPYHIISCFPFFVIGMIIKENRFPINQLNFDYKMALTIVFMVLTSIQGRVDLAGHIYGVSYILLLINALIGSYLLFSLCSYLPQKRYIQVLSTGTFLVLGLHGIMYAPINKMISILLFGYNQYIPLFSGIFVLLVLYPLINFLNKKYPFLLGKIH